MIETKTTWEDSGYDCEHCGGEVLRRTMTLPDGVAEVLFQCRACGCQWLPGGKRVRVGDGRYCQPEREQDTTPHNDISRRLFIWLGVGLLLIVARMGGLAALELLLPLVGLGLLGWTVWRMGREFEWWK